MCKVATPLRLLIPDSRFQISDKDPKSEVWNLESGISLLCDVAPDLHITRS
ncbi:MAG: hypothetical protein H6Q07_1328 [Acidobacteria bacterium]|nr:hypothetical protein [Acidobacteriota bacterium]